MYHMLGTLSTIVVCAACWYSFIKYKPDKYYIVYFFYEKDEDGYDESQLYIYNHRRGITRKEAWKLRDDLRKNNTEEEGIIVYIVKEVEMKYV